MKTLQLFRGDVRFQIKYGFYFIYTVFTVLYSFVLMLMPEEWRRIAGTVMIYSDPAALGLFFMGAIILLEKNQRVLNALAVSPVKVRDYLLAKVLSLSLISTAVSLLLSLAAGLRHIPAVLVVTALTSIIFSLLGLIAGAKIRSLNQYIIALLPLEAVCFIPPLISLFAAPPLLRFYPLCGAVYLINGTSKMPLYDICSLLILAVILFMIAHKMTGDMWRTLGGARI
ncbi:ABC transporter permease [Anaerolentibacter hominis]|uniref:fluoroquinolone export ABC transporter permease subunit n=1 Tax=Anaerolentibacter hominis TaxID=3079009 RepID=UPI0031B82930